MARKQKMTIGEFVFYVIGVLIMAFVVIPLVFKSFASTIIK
jgi:hypothetical protein